MYRSLILLYNEQAHQNKIYQHLAFIMAYDCSIRLPQRVGQKLLK